MSPLGKQATRRARLAAVTLGVLLTSACASDQPTSLLLELSAAEGVGSLDDLRLAIYGDGGLELSGYRLPASGPPELPSIAVLYPPTPGRLRLAVRGRRAGVVVAEAAEQVAVTAGTQTRAALVLEPGRALDSDGDGVPDTIDDCPQIPDPDQTKPCEQDGGPRDSGPADSGDASDGAADLPSVVEAGPDAPSDIFIPPDIIKSCTKPADCDDGKPCTDDRCESGACTYGPTICPPSGNPCKQAPRCDPTKGCVEDDKPDNTPCPDSLYCTVSEVCVNGACQTSPRDCQSSAPICREGSCDEQKNSCDYSLAPAGSSCDDGDPCTQGDSCSASGSCEPAPKVSEQIEKVNMDRRGSRTVVLDSKGAVHVVYAVSAGTSSYGLRYATNASGSWVTATLEGPSTLEVAQAPSLAIDAQDRLHAAYGKSGKLVYRRWDGSGSPALVETLVDSDGYTSITIDSAGAVHIAHGEQRGLHYAKRSSTGTWSHAVLFTPTTSTYTTTGFDIGLDGAGKVHVAHARDAGSQPLYADRIWHTSNETGSWVTETVRTGFGVGHLPSLVITSSGVLHILHGILTGTDGELALETRATATSAWTSEQIDNNPKTGSFPTLLLGAGDKLHAVYRNFDKDELRYTNNISGAWATPTVIESLGTGTGRWSSAARAPDGRIHVVYERQGNTDVRYASFSACP